jgi:hypothetical protein
MKTVYILKTVQSLKKPQILKKFRFKSTEPRGLPRGAAERKLMLRSKETEQDPMCAQNYANYVLLLVPWNPAYASRPASSAAQGSKHL